MIEWKHIFPPASDSKIELFERDTGIRLPPRYKDYLHSINGGQPRKDTGFVIPEIHEKVMLGVLYGISDDESNCLSLGTVYADSKDDVPAGFIPIGEDPGGNQLLLATTGEHKGGVFFLDRIGFLGKWTGKGMFLVASNMDEFLESLEPVLEP
jgi:hypothetical protein